MVKTLFASFVAAASADNLSGHYQGSVPFIIDVESTFNGDATADVLVDVKVAGKKFDCKAEAITETDALVTFTNTAQTGDCLGDGVREDGKDPSKYSIQKNSDGTLTFTSDGYPSLKLKKQSLAVAETLTGHYKGSVPLIIDVESTFNGDATADVLVDVKVAKKKFDCKAEAITETDALVTFTNTAQTGDCLGDGVREDGKDPSKYSIQKNSDGTLTFTSDGYPNLKLKKQSLAPAETLTGHYKGSVPLIIDVESTFNGDATADVLVDVKVAKKKFDCKAEAITETNALVTFTNTAQTGDCLGDGVREDGKDPSKYSIQKNSDGTLTFTSDGYPNLKLKKQSLAAAETLTGHYKGSVPLIIDVESTFNGDATADVLVDVKVASKKFDCKAEAITETDALVTFTNTAQTGDCLGDGVREDGKDPSKYSIQKNSDGTLTFTSDGYPNLKLKKQSSLIMV